MDATHRDLVGQVLPGRGFGTLSGMDGRRDASGRGHGTHMAGTIAAKGGAPDRALGIAPEAKILPVALGLGIRTRHHCLGIRWAADNGAKVISMSFGSAESPDPAYRPAVAAAVKYALDHDVVLVAGSGNTVTEDGSSAREDDVLTPGDIPGVIAVAATDKQAHRLATSVYGPEVVLAAPGEQIAGPFPVALAESGYGNGGFTSSATAIVSGVAALIRSRYPEMDAKNVINRLIATARDQGPPGRDPFVGFGTVRPMNALTDNVPAVTAWPLPTPQAAAPTAPGEPDGADGIPPVAFWLAAGVCVLAVVVAVVVTTLLLVARARRRVMMRAPAPPDSG